MNPSELLNDESFSFWKNLTLISLFFLVTPIVLGVSVFSLISISNTKIVEKTIMEEATPTVVLGSEITSGTQVFASLPASPPSISGSVTVGDARPEIIRQYLEDYNSPLSPYADALVSASDIYELDYRLLTAIAQQESNLCKIIPPDSHNCWGWGIHSEGTLGFDSYENAIFTVSKGLKENYIDKGYNSPEEIMSKYTPLSNGSWAYGVNKFMSDLE